MVGNKRRRVEDEHIPREVLNEIAEQLAELIQGRPLKAEKYLEHLKRCYNCNPGCAQQMASACMVLGVRDYVVRRHDSDCVCRSTMLQNSVIFCRIISRKCVMRPCVRSTWCGAWWTERRTATERKSFRHCGEYSHIRIDRALPQALRQDTNQEKVSCTLQNHRPRRPLSFRALFFTMYRVRGFPFFFRACTHIPVLYIGGSIITGKWHCFLIRFDF